jgi:hypothetical protein
MPGKICLYSTFICLCVLFSNHLSYGQRGTLSAKIKHVTPATNWQKSDSIKLQFNAYHTQGLVKVKDHFYLSSVEVTKATQKYGDTHHRYDRDTGEGIGHIFKINQQGELVEDMIVGKGTIYHPSGMDFDGQYIWFAVAEYRPHSQSTIYRLNTYTDQIETLFSVDDHIGLVIRNKDQNILIGATWDGRKFYAWPLNKSNVPLKSATKETSNLSYYIAFQDGQYIGDHLMLGSGIRHYTLSNNQKFTLGGWEILDMKTMQPVWQLSIPMVSAVTGHSMANNPCFVESIPGGIQAYFAPDDQLKTSIYSYILKVE